MKDNKKLPLGIVIRTKRADEYFHVIGSFVDLTDDQVRGVRNYGEPINGFLRFENLLITSQGNDRDADRRLYGFEIRYQDVYAVSKGDVTEMAQTLNRFDAKLSKLRDARGYPTSFGEYVARIAEVVGAKTMLFERAPKLKYHDDYARTDIADGRNRIDQIVSEWNAEKESDTAAVDKTA